MNASSGDADGQQLPELIQGWSKVLWSPQAVALGMEAMVEAEFACATLKIPYRADLVGDPDSGVIAGGVVTTLLDHTCGHAVGMAMTRAAPMATLDLRIDYMRAAEPGRDIHARAHCYKLTHSIAFVRATAYDRDQSDPVATAQAAFMLTASTPEFHTDPEIPA